MSQHNPATEQEWMTQVLNIHGTPFEHLCEHYLRQAPDWAFRSSRYPVEFPPSYTPQASLTKNGELDLWGSCLPPGLKIELLVECKKNNPDYTDSFPPGIPTPLRFGPLNTVLPKRLVVTGLLIEKQYILLHPPTLL